jgi:hypothetical protein
MKYEKIRQMEPGRWNTTTVRRELRRLHRDKEALHHAALQRAHPDLMLAAYRYFGSYGSAVDAAGLNYNRIRIRPMPSWDKKRIILRLKEITKEDTGLWKRAVRRTDPYLERAAKRCFGSYERATKAVGISPKLLEPPTYRQWSPARIADDLRSIYRKSPKLLKPSTLAETNHRLLQATRRQYGSYKKALEAAGIAYGKVARVTAPPLPAEQITSWLKDLFEAGRDLRYSHLARQNPRLLEAARRRFGSYQAAINAAGLDYPPAPPMKHWTPTLVLKTLKDLRRRKIDLRFRQLREARLPLFEAAKHYFGTYLAAVKAAKIDYDEVVSEQLRRELPARAKPRRKSVAAA